MFLFIVTFEFLVFFPLLFWKIFFWDKEKERGVAGGVGEIVRTGKEGKEMLLSSGVGVEEREVVSEGDEEGEEEDEDEEEQEREGEEVEEGEEEEGKQEVAMEEGVEGRAKEERKDGGVEEKEDEEVG